MFIFTSTVILIDQTILLIQIFIHISHGIKTPPQILTLLSLSLIHAILHFLHSLTHYPVYVVINSATHLSQCIPFRNNLLTRFPNMLSSFSAFFEVMMYLRKYDWPMTVYPVLKMTQTCILDRLFMLLLNIKEVEEYKSTVLNITQIDALLYDLFNLFIPNPQRNIAIVLLDFMRMQSTQSYNVCAFARDLKGNFPQIQKFIKEYYHDKFNKLVPKAYLLRQLQSNIIRNEGVYLALKSPNIGSASLLYCSESHGRSFHSIMRKIVGYTGPWLLLVEHSEKMNEERVYYKLGAYQNGPIRDVLEQQGDLTGYLFSVAPKLKFMTTDKGDGSNRHFFINSIPEEKSKHRMGLGFGGNADRQECKLWLDEDLDKSKVYNGKDPCYGYGALAHINTSQLNIRKCEIWGVGTEANLQEQQLYWKEREEEIIRRRKVDKKQLFSGGNAELFFGNTFAHRDQISGEIEKKQNNN